ncbi:ATP-binding protein [Syntrophotalea acetylenivorans]|nr:ATP-binding protein [Syntrophotalea acetylenivorans]
MRNIRLLWQIFPSYVFIVMAVLFGVGWHLTGAIEDFFLRQTAADLEARARLVSPQVALALEVGDFAKLDQLCKDFGAAADARFTVVLPSGVVVGDSIEDPARMENHASRVEVADGLAGRVSHSTRYSRTLQQAMMYVAVPVANEARIIGTVRAARALTAIENALKTLYRQVPIGGLVALVLAALASFWVSRRISRPLEAMRHGAVDFAQGRFDRKLTAAGSMEVCALARAMNLMAEQLDDRIRTIMEQRNEQQAVLASMVEGVLAIDMEERVLHFNQAAAQFLGVDPQQVQGQRIAEVARKADLQRFIGRTLECPDPVEGEIVLQDPETRYLQAHGTVLRDAEQQEIGVLIVLNDVTRLRRLENIRRDFVANVSHELKTPITAIKASVETLMDGAAVSPADSQEFLKIIAKQADRLNAIIDDLLALSRIEQNDDVSGMMLEMQELEPVLRSAVQSCSVAAADKEISLGVACSPALQSRINAPLIEQAVINLVDNAIKYSEQKSSVQVEAEVRNDMIEIRVRDRGCGIAREHLSRLFERFYRVDKARSRRQGGTGLGLAIVKHIVQAHSGTVTVSSEPGAGSVFTILLPAA